VKHQKKIIGRDPEKAGLNKFIDATRDGSGNLVLIAGEAGMGKTVLAEEIIAESELTVFTGRSTETVTPRISARSHSHSARRSKSAGVPKPRPAPSAAD
jgi:transcriptional regulator with GAF, ATPase, and Fis domain